MAKEEERFFLQQEHWFDVKMVLFFFYIFILTIPTNGVESFQHILCYRERDCTSL